VFTATTFKPDEITYAWLGAIIKSERDADGNVLVFGKVTDGTVDSDEQIVDPAFAKKALAEWYTTAANVRQMHSTTMAPAGKGILLDSRPDGEYVQTKVVEPTAKLLVENDVYTGYSVGISRPRIERDSRARGGRIVGGKIVEISLVDRPANPMAKFAVLKAAGATGSLRYIGKVVLLDGQAEDAEQGEPALRIKRGMHVTAHVRDGAGNLTAVEGRVTERTKGAFAVDTSQFDPYTGVVVVDEDDVQAVYQGFAPLPTIEKAAGITHTHEHTDPATGLPHTHEHTHAFNHGDHSQTHAHGHPDTEESVADDAQQPDEKPDGDEPEVTKDGKCSKCGGFGGKHADGCSAAEVTKAFGNCKTCSGKGKIRDGNVTCPDCNGSGNASADSEPDADDSDKAAAPFPPKAAPAPPADPPAPAATPPAAPSVAPPPDPDSQAPGPADGPPPPPAKKKPFGGRFTSQKREDGTAFDVLDGDKVIGSHPTAEAAEAHKSSAIDEAKREAKAEKRAKKAANKLASAPDEDTVPWLIRRAHDFTCAAYSTDVVKEAYPAIEENGVAAALGPATRQSIYSELATAVKNDRGMGTEANSIFYLAKALQDLGDFVGGEPETTLAAREELHGAFKAENPDVGSLPTPSESITPGQFKRPYISAGHQAETGTAHAPHIPTTTHPISADQFTRGPLTDGHARTLTSKMEGFHDALTSWKPDLCRMSPMTSEGRFDSLRQPPNPIVNQIENQQSASPTQRTLPPTTPAPGEKVETTHTASDIDLAAGTKMGVNQGDLTELMTKLSDLQKKYDDLAASPDPSRSALRGVAGTATKGAKITKLATMGSQKGSRKRAEKIEAWREMSASPDANLRIYAQDRLRRARVDI
jgi:hypothetical protein